MALHLHLWWRRSFHIDNQLEQGRQRCPHIVIGSTTTQKNKTHFIYLYTLTALICLVVSPSSYTSIRTLSQFIFQGMAANIFFVTGWLWSFIVYVKFADLPISCFMLINVQIMTKKTRLTCEALFTIFQGLKNICRTDQWIKSNAKHLNHIDLNNYIFTLRFPQCAPSPAVSVWSQIPEEGSVHLIVEQTFSRS